MAEDESRAASARGSMERIGAERHVPHALMVFTALICCGVMVNITVVIPTVTVDDLTLIEAGAVVGSYSMGALAGLAVFYRISKESIRSAYLLHALFMAIGNLGYAFASGLFVNTDASPGWLYFTRAIIGLEGAVMYNSIVALIHFSAAKDYMKTFGVYQFFIGLGMVLGPGLSAIFYAIGTAAGLDAAAALINFVIFLYSIGLFIALLLWLPENEELEALSKEMANTMRGSSGEETALLPEGEALREQQEEEHNAALHAAAVERAKRDAEYMRNCHDDLSTEQIAMIDAVGLHGIRMRMLIGNFLRISIRLAWEVGAVVVLIYEFNFTTVTSALIISLTGAAQTIAQMLFNSENLPSAPYMLQVMEMIQFMSILMMFMMSFYMMGGPTWFMALFFIIVSFASYVSNCLSSVPYNLLLLSANDRLDGERELLMLYSQVGIFLGFIVGPLATVGSMAIANSDTVDVLAAVLIAGWVCQAIITNIVIAGRGGTILTIMLGLVAWILLTISMVDVNVNGTGFGSVFTYHPIFMGLAFLVLMTMGVLAYRGDMQGMVPHLGQWYNLRTKKERKTLHIVLQASAGVSALLGYIFIFTAHALVGANQIGLDTTWPRTVHVYLGYIALAWVCRQITVGILKITPKEEQPTFLLNDAQESRDWVTNMMSVHGEQGRYLLMFAYCIIIEGMWLTMNTSTWDWSVKVTMTSLVGGAFIMFWLPRPLDAVPKEA